MGRISDFSGHFDGLFSDLRSRRPLADRIAEAPGLEVLIIDSRLGTHAAARPGLPGSAGYRNDLRRRAIASRHPEAGPGVALESRRERTTRTARSG